MATFARIVDGAAVDVTTINPSAIFHPEIAAQFIVVPDGTETGATYADGIWTNPPPPEPAAPVQSYLLTPSRPQFLLLFTGPERVAIRASTDALVVDFLDIVKDPALEWIDLSLASVQEGIAYLVTLTLLTQARANTILKGWPL